MIKLAVTVYSEEGITQGWVIFLQIIYSFDAFLLLSCYICFVIILQQHWSYEKTIKYECCILEKQVPLIVYIANRELKRKR